MENTFWKSNQTYLNRDLNFQDFSEWYHYKICKYAMINYLPATWEWSTLHFLHMKTIFILMTRCFNEFFILNIVYSIMYLTNKKIILSNINSLHKLYQPTQIIFIPCQESSKRETQCLEHQTLCKPKNYYPERSKKIVNFKLCLLKFGNYGFKLFSLRSMEEMIYLGWFLRFF